MHTCMHILFTYTYHMLMDFKCFHTFQCFKYIHEEHICQLVRCLYEIIVTKHLKCETKKKQKKDNFVKCYWYCTTLHLLCLHTFYSVKCCSYCIMLYRLFLHTCMSQNTNVAGCCTFRAYYFYHICMYKKDIFNEQKLL